MKKKSLNGALESFFQRFIPDEVAWSKGAFGLDATNPIPVGGIQGEYLYLSQLQTSQGARVQYQHDGSLYAPNSMHSLDRFILSDQEGRFLCKLFFDMFHVGNSKKCPQGFRLDS